MRVADLPDNSRMKGVRIRTSNGTTGYFGKQKKSYVELFDDRKLQGPVKFYPLEPEDNISTWEVLERPYSLLLDLYREPVDVHRYMHKRLPDARVYLRGNWVIARELEEFQEIILTSAMPSLISLDDTLTGFKAAQWLGDYCKKERIPLPKCIVHNEYEPLHKVNEYLKTLTGRP